MKFVDFFNPYSMDHMKAYEHLCQYGCWPKGFITDSIEITPLFVVEIHSKMAEAWLKAVKNGVIPGVPGEQMLQPIAWWHYHIEQYGDHAEEEGIVLRKEELSDAIPKDKITWTPIYLDA